MPILRIFRGCPGSGKSTLAKSYGIVHFESDMFHMKDSKYQWSAEKVGAGHMWCQRMVQEAMLKGMDVAVSNTFTKLNEFSDYIKWAGVYGYEVIVTRCTADYGNTHSVPVETLIKMKERFQDYEGEIIV
jgi:predicted ABC-type ATPase